jgi:hypothetical protein
MERNAVRRPEHDRAAAEQRSAQATDAGPPSGALAVTGGDLYYELIAA